VVNAVLGVHVSPLLRDVGEARSCFRHVRRLAGIMRRGAMPLDWSQCAAVESVPGKVSAAWVFRGTRIPVAAVFENLEDGLTINEIVQMFDGLSREQVQAVLDFTAHSLETSTPSR